METYTDANSKLASMVHALPLVHTYTSSHLSANTYVTTLNPLIST
jgi:hypothetical protein